VIVSAGILQTASDPEQHFAGVSPTGNEGPFACLACNGMKPVRTTHERAIEATMVLNTMQTLFSTPKEGSCHEVYFSDRSGDSCAGIDCGLRPESRGLLPQH
jgi:hypothetical protein